MYAKCDCIHRIYLFTCEKLERKHYVYTHVKTTYSPSTKDK